MDMLTAGGPLPKFDGITIPSGPIPPAPPIQQQNSGPIRVPPLSPDRVSQYTSLFEESGAQNGVLPGKFTVLECTRQGHRLIEVRRNGQVNI